MKTKVLLDTDIGTDIDDAVCLAYLLANPQCDLLGITTVTGEPEKRAMLASAVCKAAGRDVPIYPGSARPIMVTQQQPVAQQAAALGACPHATHFPEGQAITFMRETIRRHPHEVILLCIAPLTNIGVLFAQDPEIPSLLKGLVMMCGLFSRRIPGYAPREWNAMGDPDASMIVYRAPVPLHRSIGLDVTTKVVMSADEFLRRFTLPVLAPVRDFADVWFKEWPGTTFHDPLAAATIFDDSLCTYQRGTVAIEMDSEAMQGQTHWRPGDASSPHEIAVTVDPDRFFAHYFSVFA
jgi:purine nucleosidase